MTLDTNAYSAFKRGHARVRDLMEEADRIIMPVVVAGELVAGARLLTSDRHFDAIDD